MDLIQKIQLKKIALLSVVTGAIFGLIFQTSIRLDNFLLVLEETNNSFLLLALFAGTLSVPLAAVRWYLLLRVTNYHVTFPRTFSLVMATWTLSVIPGRVGDFARSYPIRDTVPPAISIGTIIFEKIIDLSSLLMISAVSFLVLDIPFAAFLLFFAIFGIGILFFAASKVPRYFPHSIELKIENAFTVLRMTRKHPIAFLGSVLASFINWVMSILMVFFLLIAFGAPMNIFIVSAYLPLAIIAGLLPVSIAGMGIRDSALIFFMLPFASAAQILAAGLGYTLIGYILFALLGIPYLIREVRNS